MAITIGTSGAVRMAAAQFKVDQQQRTFCYYLSNKKFIVGGASNNGAVLLNWFGNSLLMSHQSAEDFLRDAFSVASTEGLIFLPYVMGERAPLYDANASGAYIGLTMKHNQAHLKRALIEGISFAIKSIVISVEEVVTPANRISVSGGFIQSQAWVQLVCDVLGKPLEMDSNEDASSVGAAMLGFKALGIEASFAPQSTKVFSPDLSKHEYFKKEFAIFQSLYIALKDEFKKIKQL
jgi:gluconokinase